MPTASTRRPWSRRHWRRRSCAARRRPYRGCRRRIPCHRYWRPPRSRPRACRAPRSGADDVAFRFGFAKRPWRQPDHDALDAAIADDQVGADTDDIDRQVLRKMLQEVSEVVFVRRREQHLRRTADAKPRQLRKRLVRQQPPAQIRHRGFEIGGDVGKAQRLAQRLQFARQRVGPLRDVAGAEADDEIAAAGDGRERSWRVRRRSAAE